MPIEASNSDGCLIFVHIEGIRTLLLWNTVELFWIVADNGLIDFPILMPHGIEDGLLRVAACR